MSQLIEMIAAAGFRWRFTFLYSTSFTFWCRYRDKLINGKIKSQRRPSVPIQPCSRASNTHNDTHTRPTKEGRRAQRFRGCANAHCSLGARPKPLVEVFCKSPPRVGPKTTVIH